MMKKLISLICLLAMLVQMPVYARAAEEPPAPPATEEPIPEDAGEPAPPADPDEAEPPAEAAAEEEPVAPAEAEDEPVTPGEMLPSGESIDLAEAEVFTAEEVGADDEGNIYDQLNLDLLETESKEELEARSKMKPYGEKDFNITINEVFTMGAPAPENQASDKTFTTEPLGRLYGHNASVGHTLNDPTWRSSSVTLYTDGPSSAVGGKNDRSIMVAGDFTGSGKKGQVAVLASRGADSVHTHLSNSIQLSVGEPYNQLLYDIGVLSRKPSSGAWINTEFAADDLNIATGDLDGDGVDEIVVLIPVSENGDLNARLQVYKLYGGASYTSAITSSGNGWRQVYDEKITIGFGNTSLSSSSGIKRNHALAVGDLDGDGCDDIAVASSELTVYAATNLMFNDFPKNKSRLRLNLIFPKAAYDNRISFSNQKIYSYIGDKTDGKEEVNSSTETGTIPLFMGPGQGGLAPLMYLPTRADIGYTGKGETGVEKESQCLMLPTNLGVEIVDVDGALGNELLLGYTLFGITNNGGAGKNVGYVGYGADVAKYDKNSGIGEMRRRGTGKHLLVSVLDIAEQVRPTSDSMKYDGINVDYFYDVYSWVSNFLKLSYTATKLTAARLNAPAETPYIIVGNNRHKANGNTYTFELPKTTGGPSMFGYFPLTSAKDGEYDVHIYSLEPGALSNTGKNGPEMVYGYLIHYYRAKWMGDDDAVYTEFITGNGTAQPSATLANGKSRMLASKANVLGMNAGVLLDTDNDSVRLSYVSHEIGYSAPTVVAALASQPYYYDIGRLEGRDFTGNGGTSYGLSTGVGSGSSNSNSISLGAYVSAEVEVGCSFAKAHMEFEINTGKTWTDEVTSNTTQTATTTITSSGQDSVVLVAYPIDIYRYSMTYPTNDRGSTYAVCDYTVNVPYTPSTVNLSLDEYNKVYQEFPDILPDLDKEVFTHEVGYPSTYPSSPIRNAYLSKSGAQDWTTSPTSPGLSEAHELEITESTEAVSTSSNSVDLKVGAGASAGSELMGVSAKVTAGITFGTESSSGTISTNTEGITYGGQVGGIPTTANPADYAFQWRMMQYMYHGKQDFPVITYLVRNDRNAVNLPVDYGVADEMTNDKQVTLYWEPSRNDVNPGLGSSMAYGVFNSAGVQVQSNATLNYDTRARRYYYTITGLDSSTVYALKLACWPKIRTQGRSVYSETIYAATNPTGQNPYYTTHPGDLTLRPDDKEYKLSATIADVPSGVTYYWQYYNKNTYEWEQVSESSGVFTIEEDTHDLIFNVPSKHLVGSYRMGVQLSLGGATYKQFYSEVAEVTHSPYTAEVTLQDNPMLQSAETFVPESEELRQALEEAIQQAEEEAAASTATDISPGIEMGALSVVTGNTISFTADAALGEEADLTTVPTGMLQFYLTHPTGSLDIRRAAIGPDGTATSGNFILPRNGVYELEIIYPGDSVYQRTHSKVIRFYRITSGSSISLLSTDFTMPDNLVYGDKITIPTRRITGTDQTGTSVTPVIKLEQLVGNKYKSVPTSWVSGNTIQFRGVGKYRITLSYSGASNTLVYEVAVSARPLVYRISNIVRYEGLQVPSPEDLEIVLEEGSIISGDTLIYQSRNLAVYNLDETEGLGENVTAKKVTLDENLKLGTYSIRMDHTLSLSADNKYQVRVIDGTYVYKKSTNTAMVAYQVRGTGGKVGPVLPQGLASGDAIEKGTRLTLQALPDDGYVVGGWRIVRDNDETTAVETGAGKEVLTLDDITQDSVDIEVWFTPQSEGVTTKLTIYPSGDIWVEQGSKLQLYAELEGSQAGVRWTVYHDNIGINAGTFIDGNGLLSIDSAEWITNNPHPNQPTTMKIGRLVVRATAKDNPSISEEVRLSVGGSGQGSSYVDKVIIKAPVQTVIPGGVYRFLATVVAVGSASAECTWTLDGAQGATILGDDGVLQVGEDEPSGTVLTLMAASAQTPSISATVQVLVSSVGADDVSETGELDILPDRVTLTAGGEALVVPVFRAKGVLLNAPTVHHLLTNRREPLTTDALTATLDENENDLVLTPGADAAGESFVVRVAAIGVPRIWDECRVDIVAALPDDVTDVALERRGIGASTITAYAHSTANVVVPLYGETNPKTATTPMSLLSDRVQVMLPEGSKLREVFKPELVKLDDNQVVLEPIEPEAMANSKTTTFKNQTLELLVDGVAKDLITGTFTLKINKSKPTIKAAPIVLDTWAGKATAEAVFTGGTVTALSGNQPKNTDFTYNGEALTFTAEKGTRGSTTVKLEATVKGWSVPVNVSIKVTATNTQPGLKLKSATAKLYKTSALSGGTTLTLMPKNKKDSLKSLGVASVEVDGDFADRYAVSDYNMNTGSFTLRALQDPKKGKVPLVVRFGGARSQGTVTLNVSVSVVTTALKLKPLKASVTINKNLQEAYDLPLALNVSDVDIANYSVTLADTTKDNAKIPKPEPAADGRSLHIELGENAVVGKTNKYVLSLWGNPSEDGSQPLLHKTTISVKVSGAAAKVSLAAKGKLDISKSEPAPITVTAKFANFMGSYDADILNDDIIENDHNVKFAIYRKVGKRYEAVYDESGTLTLAEGAQPGFTLTRTGPMTWQLLPKKDVNLEPGTYRIGIVEGNVLGGTRQIGTAPNTKSSNDPSRNYTKFTVTASKPKVTVSGQATLYRGHTNSEHAIRLTLPEGTQPISKVTLAGVDNPKMYFDIQDLGNGRVVIHFHQTHFATVKGQKVNAIDVAKTKTLTLNILLKDGSTTKAVTTAKVKVNVL